MFYFTDWEKEFNIDMFQIHGLFLTLTILVPLLSHNTCSGCAASWSLCPSGHRGCQADSIITNRASRGATHIIIKVELILLLFLQQITFIQ